MNPHYKHAVDIIRLGYLIVSYSPHECNMC